MGSGEKKKRERVEAERKVQSRKGRDSEERVESVARRWRERLERK